MRSAMNREDSLKTLEGAARFAAAKGLNRFTRFLDPAQRAEAEQIARASGVAFDSFGGYPQAERAIGCFHPYDVEIKAEDYPLVCLHARYASRFCTLTHRDLLGAFMALGLTRDSVGDMIIEYEDIFLFVSETVAGYVSDSLTSVGRASLRFEALAEIPPMPEPKGQAFSSVVSSLRLDAVLAAAYKLSRSEASEAIRAGLVKVDHLPCSQTDARVEEGALLSLRGKGRVRFVSSLGTTRKQRISVSFFRYE